MKRILIWKKLNYEIDIYQKTDINNVYTEIKKRGDSCPNWGNKIWYQAIISEISTSENEIVIRTNQTYDEINQSFDLIVYPMANTFGCKYKTVLENLASVFKNIKIPVYVIACGVQTTDNSLNSLIDDIGEASKKFISAIYETGGEFALRGYITKEFFDKLGFFTAVVTGCPSLYQLGKQLQVNVKKIDEKEFNPIFNGKHIAPFEEALESFSSSVFVDQNEYFIPLVDENLQIKGIKEQIKFCYNYGCNAAKLLSESRIVMFADMNDWRAYLINSGFNYSFGSRIHGNIMAILCGIPATVVGLDCRVIEMADFFEIPLVPMKKTFSSEDVYEAYCMADYSKFNAHFEEHYNNFENFLQSCGIVEHINENNLFFNQDSICSPAWNGYDNFKKIYRQMKRNKFLIDKGIKVSKFLKKK